jgi:hypothetical protein
MVTGHGNRRSGCSPTKAGWWGRLIVTAAVAFYLGYIPVHLATERHLEDELGSLAHELVHQDAHGDADHSDHSDSDNHKPHPASQHELSLTARTQSPSVPLPVFLLPVESAVLICLPEPQPPLPVFERIRPPGESPPDPLQPRAPPLV